MGIPATSHKAFPNQGVKQCQALLGMPCTGKVVRSVPCRSSSFGRRQFAGCTKRASPFYIALTPCVTAPAFRSVRCIGCAYDKVAEPATSQLGHQEVQIRPVTVLIEVTTNWPVSQPFPSRGPCTKHAGCCTGVHLSSGLSFHTISREGAGTLL